MKQKLLNKYEEITYDKLRNACAAQETHVFPKVRLADTFNISGSGLKEEEFTFCLKAHFDFIVTDKDYIPLFSVEYDGAHHKTSLRQRQRDMLKNVICEHFQLPILRINSKYIDKKYRGLDLLTYFIDVWFLCEAFCKAQEEGLVANDEPFDPASIVYDGTKGDKPWPYWISADAQAAINRLFDLGKVSQPGPSYYVGIDLQGNYRCICWLLIPDDKAIYVTTGMRSQNFPVMESDLISMIAMFDIYEKIKIYLEKPDEAISRADMSRKLVYYRENYSIRCSAGWNEPRSKGAEAGSST